MSIITVLQLLNKSEAAWKHFATLNRTMCRNCFVKTMMTNLCTSSNLINLNDPCRPNSRTATVFTWIFLKFTQYHLFVFWTEPFHMIFLGIGYLGGKMPYKILNVLGCNLFKCRNCRQKDSRCVVEENHSIENHI